MRETYGATASTSVATGRIIVFGSFHGMARPGEVIVTAGSQWKTVVEKMATSRMPVTNSGSAASMSSRVWMIVSGRRRR